MIENTEVGLARPEMGKNGSIENAFYKEFIDWNEVEGLIQLVNPEEESHPETRITVFNIIDGKILDTLLSHLNEADHAEFMQEWSSSHQDQSLLGWLRDKAVDAEQVISSAFTETVQDLKARLEEE